MNTVTAQTLESPVRHFIVVCSRVIRSSASVVGNGTSDDRKRKHKLQDPSNEGLPRVASNALIIRTIIRIIRIMIIIIITMIILLIT